MDTHMKDHYARLAFLRALLDQSENRSTPVDRMASALLARASVLQVYLVSETLGYCSPDEERTDAVR